MEESWYERHERSVEGQLSGLNGQMFLRHRLENPQETGNLADRLEDPVLPGEEKGADKDVIQD